MKKRMADRPSAELAPPGQKARRRDLRRRNKWLLLHLIQTAGPSSMAELARRSGLSPAAVSGILRPLIEQQILVEEGKTTAGAGRRASILGFNPRAALTVGVAIEQEECETALVDMSARVVDHESTTYPRYTEPHEVVGLAASSVCSLVERNGVMWSSLVGIGVAMPGLIDSGSGLVSVAANLGWRIVQLRALFEQKLRLPTRVEHLGMAKARAEAIWGKGAGHRNFVCLEIGSGIGAGVMADGRILRGARESAGEVGHTLLDPRGPRCACGLSGCWEVFCAGPAIRRRLAEHLATEDGSTSSLWSGSTLGELGQAAERGDEVACRVLEETAQYLARGLVGVIWSFDPELVILSGPVVRDCPRLVQATRAQLAVLEAARKFDIPVVPATEESTTAVVAASAIASCRHLEELASQRSEASMAQQEEGIPAPAAIQTVI